MVKRLLAGLCITAALVLGSTSAQAVPSLGVGTGTFDCSGATEYWGCFSGNLGGESFALPSSGGTIAPWSNITGNDIWLLAEPSIGTFTFNGQTSTAVATSGAFASYDTPYQGIDLGQVNGSWTEISSNLWNPGTFAMLPGTLTYTGTDVVGDWLFVVADDNGTPGLQGTGPGGPNDSFSPKTTSAVGVQGGGPVPVPEPSMVMLFGAGLVGLPLFRLRMKRG